MTNDETKNSARTEIISGTNQVLERFLSFMSGSKTIKCCGNSNTIPLAFKIKEYRDLLYSYYNRNINIKFVTEITKENIPYCKKILDYVELRHFDGIRTDFILNESEFIALGFSLHNFEKFGNTIQKIIYSNVEDLVGHQIQIFESFWNRSVPAEQKIKDLEREYEIGNTEVIQYSRKTKELLIDMVKKSKEEVLLLLPTINAFLREYRIGVFKDLMDSVLIKNVNVVILTPTNEEIDKIIKSFKGNEIKNFVIYPFEVANEMKINTITILVVDKRESLVIEKTDDSKENFEDAIGLSTYSTSKPTVISYVSIFESLINQIKLYERLKIHGKMQEEFLNIASHELRTPIQAILAYSDLIDQHPEKRVEMVEALKRNASYLQRLAEDILIVTKIESKTLVLHREKFDIENLLYVFIEDYKKNIRSSDKYITIDLNYIDKQKKSLYVEADYQRIIQVFTNLLDNAVKFTKELKEKGRISIIVEEKSGANPQVIFKIKDNGKGIDEDILPRLFTKFASKSERGTGLGLFISKSIVESHCGKIWAENNKDGNGATFSFCLPLNFIKDDDTFLF